MHVLVKRLVSIHNPAVLLVTHDVDEAIALADRIIVLDQGVIVADLANAQRDNETDQFEHTAAIRRLLLRHLGVGHDGRALAVEPAGAATAAV